MSEVPPGTSAEKVQGLDPFALLAHARPRPVPAEDRETRRVGDYELISQIAEGGMGVVWRARQISLQRIVALKMIRSGLLATSAEVERFHREAKAAASLDHPHIVPIYEVGEDNGRHFFSMKLITGGNLADLKAECGEERRCGLEWMRHATALVAAMARAVHHAHQRGLLHRDIKPTNVLLDEEGEPHLTDFGLAKLLEPGQDMTLTLAVVGTPGYMAPEQAAGSAKGLTIAVDVYGLGAVFYELLSGRQPFEAETTLALLRKVQEREPVPPRKLNPRLPRPLEVICLKCLTKDPHRRYSNAEELAGDLERWRDGKPILARPPGTLVRMWLWSRRNPLAAAVGLLLLALAAILGLGVLRLRTQRDEINETLRDSLIAQARMHRLSVLQGSREERLRVLTQAAQIRPSLEVRNEVIAALAASDLGPSRLWHHAKPQPMVHQRMMTADGTHYAIFGQQEGITVFRREDDVAVAELITPPGRLARGRITADGHYLIIYGEAMNVFVWDLHRSGSGPHRHSFMLPGPWERDPDFTQDCHSIVLMGKDKGLRFFNLETGVEQRRIDLPFVAQAIAISPSGNQAAFFSGGSLFVWDLNPPAQIQKHSHHSSVSAWAWHPQGRFLAAGYDSGEIQLFDSQSGAARWLPPHGKYVNSLSFDAGGELLASSAFDGIHRFSDTATGRVLFETRERGGLQATNDNRCFATFDDDGSISAREIQRSSVFRTLSSARTGYPALNGLDISPDGKWIVSGERNLLHIWNRESGNEVASIASSSSGSPRFHPGGEYLVTGGPGGQMKWPFHATGNSRVSIGPPETIASVDGAGAAFTTDGQWCAVPGGNFGSLVMHWSDPSQRVSFGQNLPPRRHNHVVLSPDGKWVAGAAYQGVGVTVWDAHNGHMLQHLVEFKNAQLAVSPDGRTLATATAEELVLWNTATWQAEKQIPSGADTGVQVPVNYSHDGTLLAIALTRTEIRLLDSRTYDLLAILSPPLPLELESLVFSADNRFLAAQAGGPVLHLWDLDTLRKELSVLHLNW